MIHYRASGLNFPRSCGLLLVLLCLVFATSCKPVPGTSRALSVERGQASWYGRALHGNPTASGEPFDMRAYTAAHKTLPFGTIVRVVRVDDGRYVVVRINDRGPFARGRIIDLSRAAADAIGMVREGVTDVVVEVLELPGD